MQLKVGCVVPVVGVGMFACVGTSVYIAIGSGESENCSIIRKIEIFKTGTIVTK